MRNGTKRRYDSQMTSSHTVSAEKTVRWRAWSGRQESKQPSSERLCRERKRKAVHRRKKGPDTGTIAKEGDRRGKENNKSPDNKSGGGEDQTARPNGLRKQAWSEITSRKSHQARASRQSHSTTTQNTTRNARTRRESQKNLDRQPGGALAQSHHCPLAPRQRPN